LRFDTSMVVRPGSIVALWGRLLQWFGERARKLRKLPEAPKLGRFGHVFGPELIQAEIDKYRLLRTTIADWLASAGNYSEKDWQRMILKVGWSCLSGYPAEAADLWPSQCHSFALEDTPKSGRSPPGQNKGPTS
jgi:hypothetical protein